MGESKQKHNEKSCGEKMKEFPGLFWHHIRSWQFVYLVFFTVGNSLSIYFSDTTTTSASYWSPFALMIVALLVKSISIWGKISLKDLWEMQIGFVIPYILTVINIILLINAGTSISSITIISQGMPNLMSFMWVYSAEYVIVTLVCSLVMNRKTTTKMQYYLLVLNIALQAAANLYLTIDLIQTLNSGADDLQEQNKEILLDYMSQQITLDSFNEYYEMLHKISNGFDNAKDFALASFASIIAVLLIMMDMIGRPFQKVQLHQQIYQGFIKNYNLPVQVKRTEQNQIKLNLLPQQELTSFPRNTFKNAQIDTSQQSTRR